MNLYSDPHTALVLARFHQDLVRESFPRRPRVFSLPRPVRRRLEVVPAAPGVGADRQQPPGSGSAAA